jgi:hypothetical protein
MMTKEIFINTVYIMDFFNKLKNFNNYGPKSFKGKSVKDILAMTSSKVPDDWSTDKYTDEHAKEFADANLTDEQENAIELLSDLKNKPEIIRKCYNKPKNRVIPKEQSAPQAPAQAKGDDEEEEESANGPAPGPGPGPAPASAQKPLTGGKGKGKCRTKKYNKKSKRKAKKSKRKVRLG